LHSTVSPSRIEKRLFFYQTMKEFPMKSTTCNDIHRIKYSKGKTTPRKCRENRALLGSRFKILLVDAGLSPEEAGKLLHVTPRTIRYWISGKVTVPYAAYRLVRVLRLFELPMPGWEGWHMHSGKLWSPEGYGFMPADSEWWSNLVRKSRLFHVLYDRERQLDIAMQRMKDGGTEQPAGGRARACSAGTTLAAPVTPTAKRAGGEAGRPNLLLEHFGTPHIPVVAKQTDPLSFMPVSTNHKEGV
jgi:DNA-binding transcriptional regulator YiaG